MNMAGLFPDCSCRSRAPRFSKHSRLIPPAELDWRRIRDVFMEEARPHYRSIWDHFDEPARESLGGLVGGKSISAKYAYVKDDLVRRGYIVESGNAASLCSPRSRIS